MVEYLTIEQVKAELDKNKVNTGYPEFAKGYEYALYSCKRILDRLEPPDEKLRKVREEIRNLKQFFEYRSSKIKINMSEALEIIDSHLTPSEPEIDEELEEVRKKFPVGSKFKREGKPTLLEVEDVHRNDFGNIRIVDHEDFAWIYTNKECLFVPYKEPTEAEKLRKEAEELISRINNAVDKLGK